MKNYFKGWWPKKNSDNQNTSEIGETVPTKDAPLNEWVQYINTHSWKDVLHLRAKFIMRAGSQKDEEIWHMMCQKLMQIERPVVSDDFITKHKDRIIRVDSFASNQTVKNTVAKKYAAINKPCFIVEQSGTLRGFALSENLVIAGVSAIEVFPHAAVKKVLSLELEFLTREDSALVETNFFELNQMMVAANVPGICSQWMIADTGKMLKDPYKGYDTNHPNRFTYYEEDDFTVIFAKL